VAGAAADAYRNWATQRDESLQALAKASDTMALITEGAGMLIGARRCARHGRPGPPADSRT
jgi:hypothetical protein